MIWKNVVRTNIACTNVNVNLSKMVQGTYLYSLVKIGPLTAEILLTLSFCGGWWVVVVGGGGGVKSFLRKTQT